MPNYDVNPASSTKLPAQGIADLRELLSVNNTNNTSDANKPVSTATQTALGFKADLASPNFSGTPTLAGEPLATQAYATAAAGNTSVNKYAVHSAFGEGLIDMVAAKSDKGASGANIFYFSANKTSDITMSVGSSTGYVLPILFDGSTGTQAGDGNAAAAETLTFHPGGVNYTTPRAAGVMSVAATDTDPSGTITYISFNNDKVTFLSLNGLNALTYLSCNDNLLATLDVSTNTALTELYCSGNNLTALDVSTNTALTKLDCPSNNLTALDVSTNTALTELNCFSNNLTALDVSTNTVLSRLICDENQLTEAAVNGILTDILAGAVNNGNLNLSGGTNAVPTGAGLAAVTTLRAAPRNWNVTVNE